VSAHLSPAAKSARQLLPLGEWVFAFALLSFSFISGFSIGFLILPLALIATAVAGYRSRDLPHALWGAPIGVGCTLLLIAYLNRDYVPCDMGASRGLSPGQSYSCGGFDPMPWLLVGAGLLAIGALGYLRPRNRQTA
jgi:hypothetical protein